VERNLQDACSGYESETGATRGPKMHRVGGIPFKFVPQPEDMVIDGLRETVVSQQME
jgi:hypothetical protein